MRILFNLVHFVTLYPVYVSKFIFICIKMGLMEKIKSIKIGGYGDEADSFSIFNRFGSIGF